MVEGRASFPLSMMKLPRSRSLPTIPNICVGPGGVSSAAPGVGRHAPGSHQDRREGTEPPPVLSSLWGWELPRAGELALEKLGVFPQKLVFRQLGEGQGWRGERERPGRA